MLEKITLATNTETHLPPGDRILVSFGDTLILGTIYSANSLAEGKVVALNVQTDVSDQTYSIHEFFLRHAIVTVK